MWSNDKSTRVISEGEFGVYTRYNYLIHLKKLIKSKKEYVCCIVGVSDFYLTNLTQGMLKGVVLLDRLLEILNSVENVTVYHWYAGKFMLLIEGFDISGLECILQHKLKGILSDSINIEYNWGIYTPSSKVSIEGICCRLEFALRYANKLGIRGKVNWGKDLELEYKRYRGMHCIVEDAFKNNTFEIKYQPIISLHTGDVVKLEALSRLKVKGKYIPPIDFIGAVNECGRSMEFTKRVIEQVCKFISDYNIKQRVYINISVKDFTSVDFLGYVYSIAEKYSVDLESLGFELLETENVIEYPRAVGVINALKKVGVSCVLDDFGTGNSNLEYLGKLPVMDLKISKSLVDDISSNVLKRKVVKTIVNLAKTFDLAVTAEGIEDKETLDILKGLGCDQIQGYFYDKPLSIPEFITKYYVK